MAIEQVEVNGQVHQVERPEGMSDEQFGSFLSESIIPQIQAATVEQAPQQSANEPTTILGALAKEAGKQWTGYGSGLSGVGSGLVKGLGDVGSAVVRGIAPQVYQTPEQAQGMLETSQDIERLSATPSEYVQEKGVFGLPPAPPSSVEFGRGVTVSGAMGAGVGGLGSLALKPILLAAKRGSKLLGKVAPVTAGKVTKALDDTVRLVSKDPVKAMQFEAAIGGVSEGSGEAVERLTGSKGAGLTTSLATGIMSPSLLAKVPLVRKLFEDSPALRYSVLDDALEGEFATLLRGNPEMLARASTSMEELEAMKVPFTIGQLSKHPSIAHATEAFLRRGGSQEAANNVNTVLTAASEEMGRVLGKVTSGRLTPDDAEYAVKTTMMNLEDQKNAILRSMPDVRAIGSVSSEYFDKMFSTVNTTMLKEIDNAYKGVDLSASTDIGLLSNTLENVLTPFRGRVTKRSYLKGEGATSYVKDLEDVLGIIKSGDGAALAAKLKTSLKSDQSALDALKASKYRASADSLEGIDQDMALLRADIADKQSKLKRIASSKEEVPVVAKEVTVDEIRQLRSTILSDMRSRGMTGKSTSALSNIERGLTDVLSSVSGLKDANELYRMYRTHLYDAPRIGGYLDSTSKTRQPEKFAQDILMSSPRQGYEAVENFVAKVGAERGITMDTARDMARDGYLAIIGADGREFTKEAWTKFMSRKENLESLSRWGLLGEFRNYEGLVARADEITRAMGDLSADKMALSKYGFDADTSVLAARVNQPKALKREIDMLPSQFRDKAKRAVLHSIVFDSDGVIKPVDEISRLIKTHANQIGIDPAESGKILALSRLLSTSPDTPVRGLVYKHGNVVGLDDAFANTDLAKTMSSIALERITRLKLKAARAAYALHTFSSYKSAKTALTELLTTPEGAKKILKLAKSDPQSRALVKAILYGRPAVEQATIGAVEGQEQ